MSRGYLGEYAGGLQLAYENALAQQDPALANVINQNALPGEDWLAAAFRVAQSALLADSQRRLLNIQIERARQGMAPLDASQYGLGVNVGLSPDTLKMVGIGAAVLVGLYFVSRRR